VILVDTSVWVDHLRRGSPELGRLLEEGEVLTHPFVIGELACGTMPRREEFLALLGALPSARLAEHGEVLQFVGHYRLYGRGLGWIDMHLLASAGLSAATLWTLDRPLRKAAAALRLTP